MQHETVLLKVDSHPILKFQYDKKEPDFQAEISLKMEKQRKKEEAQKALEEANYGWKLHEKKRGDRYDGRLLQNVTMMQRFMPYIMMKRSDACNTFADSFEVTKTDAYIRRKRAAGLQNFGFIHVLLAAYVRTLAQWPGINRYVSGQKIYARTQIAVVMTIKRKMSSDSPDTCIKVKFYPSDTAEEVYYKFSKVVDENAVEDGSNDFDALNQFLCHIPGLLLRYTCKGLFALDYWRLLPKGIIELSPFHGSMIVTSMGSLGIKPIYHHLYDFGNLPVFLAYGVKHTEEELNRKGEVVKRKYVDVKAVTDERIVDGYYYAAAFKTLKQLVENPKVLDLPPESVEEDVD